MIRRESAIANLAVAGSFLFLPTACPLKTIKNLSNPIKKGLLRFYQCRWRDLNPHVVAHKRF